MQSWLLLPETLRRRKIFSWFAQQRIITLSSLALALSLSLNYICPAKLAASLGSSMLVVVDAWWCPFPFDTTVVDPFFRLFLREMDPLTIGHLLVTLMRFEKNSMAPSPVMSMSPYLLRVPYNPPKEKGSRGTGILKVRSERQTNGKHTHR